MKKEKRTKEIRLNVEDLNIRNEEQAEESKMIVEGYPIVFNKETYIECWCDGFFEKIDPAAFENADMSDVCLKYNHNDNIYIAARTRNGSLTLTPDEHGIFMHAELIDTSSNVDLYKMVKSGLLKEGSFAFTVESWEEEIIEGETHRTITGIDKLFDVSICVNGAYGDMTEIYARSLDLLESKKQAKVETEKRVRILKLRNQNKIKIMKGKQRK